MVMRIVTFLYLASLAVWIGGIVLVGIVAAPTIFRQLESRTEAGDLLGAILARFDTFMFVCIAIVVITTVIKTGTSGLAGVLPWVRIAGVVLMVAGLMWSTLIIKPQMTEVRTRIESFDASAGDDPERAAFDTLHTQSRRSMSLALVGALLALLAY